MDESVVAALRERVHDPRDALRGRVHGGLLAVGDWNPDLHPRGHDGKFIEVGWLVDLIDMAGFRHSQRGKQEVQGEVIDIIPDPDDPGNPIIRVKMTDPRWNPDSFGETYDARGYQVSKREPSKATIPKKEAPDIELLPEGESPAPKPKLPKVTPVASLGEPLPPMPEPPGKVTAEWVSAQMTADLTVFRGKETIWSMPGADPDLVMGLAETYRQLTHDDTDTALRVDYIITDSQAGMAGDPLIKPTGPSAIAVAHPGTTHPGGIGPKVGKTAIVLGDRFVKDTGYWDSQKGSSQGGLPWSMSSSTGSINQTITHEFGHQRQFRMLALAMDEVGQPWSDVTQPDGFGTVPDSSNWPEIQQARYDMQKMAPTAYGRSKSSEAYAEIWSASLLEDLSTWNPDLQETWDRWHEGMSLVDHLPQERFGDDDRKPYLDLTDSEKAAYWEQVGPVLDLTGMREHYPDTAVAYDDWVNSGSENGTDGTSTPSSATAGTQLAGRLAASSVAGDAWQRTDTGGSGTGGGAESDLAIARYDLSPEFQSELEAQGHIVRPIWEIPSSPEGAQMYHDAVANARDTLKFGTSVTVYDPDEYEGDVRLFLMDGGKAGFAVKSDGQIISVFNSDSEIKGPLYSLIPLALANGGTRADAFDTVLPGLYAPFGLQATARTPFVDEYAPDGWDYDLYSGFNEGRPDVVFLKWVEEQLGKPYEPGSGVTVEEYDDGLAMTATEKLAVAAEIPNADLFDMQIEADDDGDGGLIELWEKDGGSKIAHIKWRQHGVSYLGVVPEYRRQGVATALFRKAREIDPELKHGMVLSDDATAWVKSLPSNEQQQIGK